jgi:stage II sporulation protein D
MRVGLQSCVGHPSSITLKANEGLTITDLDTKTVIAEIEVGKEITLRLNGKLLEVEPPVPAPAPDVSDGSDMSNQPDESELACDESAEVPAPTPTFKGPIRIATQTSEGMIEIVAPKLRYKHYREAMEIRGGTRLSVINELSVEHYVYGVTPTEIPASFHPEAQKALVVAARTYSIRNCERHKADGFNMCDSVHCQGFAGADRETEWVRKIVDATRGEVITYKGEPIYALYSADCGGMTQSSEDSGMIRAPYLISVADNASGEACLVVQKKAVISDQSPVTSDQSDGADQSDGSDSSDESGESASGDASRNTDSSSTTCPTPPMTEFERPATGDYCGSSRVHTWTKTCSVEDLERVFSRSSSTKVGKLVSMEFAEYDCSGRVKSIVIKGDAGEKRISGSRLRDLFGLSTMMSTRMALTVTAEGKYVIEGRGYGHGVGLCQWGANGMAKSREGVTYIDILKHYYTGVEVTRMRSDESDTPSPLD